MLMALRESKRGRKDWESRGFAATSEVRPWREEGGERNGFGRKSAARAGGARKGHLGSCLRWPGERLPALPAAAAAAPAPGAGPPRAQGDGTGRGHRAGEAAAPSQRASAAGTAAPAGDRLSLHSRGRRAGRCLGWLAERGPVRGHRARCCVGLHLVTKTSCEFLPRAECSRDCEQLD